MLIYSPVKNIIKVGSFLNILFDYLIHIFIRLFTDKKELIKSVFSHFSLMVL